MQLCIEYIPGSMCVKSHLNQRTLLLSLLGRAVPFSWRQARTQNYVNRSIKALIYCLVIAPTSTDTLLVRRIAVATVVEFRSSYEVRASSSWLTKASTTRQSKILS